jgi:hypothetical protein
LGQAQIAGRLDRKHTEALQTQWQSNGDELHQDRSNTHSSVYLGEQHVHSWRGAFQNGKLKSKIKIQNPKSKLKIKIENHI